MCARTGRARHARGESMAVRNANLISRLTCTRARHARTSSLLRVRCSMSTSARGPKRGCRRLRWCGGGAQVRGREEARPSGGAANRVRPGNRGLLRHLDRDFARPCIPAGGARLACLDCDRETHRSGPGRSRGRGAGRRVISCGCVRFLAAVVPRAVLCAGRVGADRCQLTVQRRTSRGSGRALLRCAAPSVPLPPH